MKHIFLTYGDNNFKRSKERIKREAENFGFDIVHIYSPNDISEDFKRVLNSISDRTYRGSIGYWIWKTFILKKTMDSHCYGDVITYCDAGCTVQKSGREKYFHYVDMLSNSNFPILSFQLIGDFIFEFTKRDVLDYFGISIDDDIVKKEPYHSTVIIFIKNKYTEDLINEYYNIAINRPDLFTDFNINKNYPGFKDARHDQSIFSILRRLRGCVETEDRTISNNSFNGLENEPFLSTRIKC